MRSPIISVIVPVYNGQDSLSLALESALNQTIAPDDYEIVVVNDGSTDQTESIIRSYASKDDRFKIIHNDANVGLVQSCNIGVASSTGSLLIRLDHDDVFKHNILEKMRRPLDDGITDLVYSDRYETDLQQSHSQYISLSEFNLFQLTAIGVMMRRKLLQGIGGYRQLFWEEYDLYIRYAQASDKPFFHLPEPLYEYTKNAGTLTADEVATEAGWHELFAIWGVETLSSFGSHQGLNHWT